MTFEEQVGCHLMIGISGPKLTLEIVKQFQRTHAAGLIVFRPNFKSALAFKELLSGLEAALGRKLLIAVDHEGGRVIHLAEGITVFPDNWSLGNTGQKSYAARQGAIEALELRRLGMDLNLAPTLDVLTEQFSPNIGIRSYGKSSKCVAELGAARIRAMQKNGLSACAKHFPGLGASTLDPHLDLPVLGMTWKELKKVHLKPFLEAMKSGVDCVMSSHPVYPKLDASKVPATFSRKIIRDFLRETLAFKGVILSDDLEMGALRGLCSIGESAVRAVAAGHDMVLLCHDMKAQSQAFEALLAAYRSGRLKPKDLNDSLKRVEKLIDKRATRFEGGVPRTEKEGEKLAAKIAEEGVRFTPSVSLRALMPMHQYRKAAQRIVLSLRAKRSNLKAKIASDKKRSRNDEHWVVIFPKFSDLAGKFYIEKEMLETEKWLRDLFIKYGVSASVKTVSLNPDKKETEGVLKQLRQENTVFFCYDAHLSPGSRRILKALGVNKNNAAVLLRDPYDAVYIEGKIPFVTAYGFRKVQVAAAVHRLCKEMKAVK